MRSQICVWVARDKAINDKVSKRSRYANRVTNLYQNDKQKQQKVLDLLRKFK